MGTLKRKVNFIKRMWGFATRFAAGFFYKGYNFIWGYSQKNILAKITIYLKKMGRDAEFIEDFKEGYCYGIASLWLYAKWLQTQPKYFANPQNPEPRDDYDRFKSIVDLIADWDGVRALWPEEEAEFERFIYQIELFQNSGTYLQAGQDGLDISFEDTQNRKLEKEYTVSSLFTLDKLKQFLNTNDVVQEGKLIMISSFFGRATVGHATALFRRGNDYYFFDANSRSGEVKKASLDQVAAFIFKANSFPSDSNKWLGRLINFITWLSVRYIWHRFFKPGGSYSLRFDTYSFDEAPEFNRARETGRSFKFVFSDFQKNDFELMRAVSTGNLGDVQSFLREGFDPDCRTVNNHTALMFAAMYGYLEIVAVLLEENINPNAQVVGYYDKSSGCDENGWTAFMYAVRYGHIDLVRLFLKREGVDVSIKSKYGQTALMLATKYGYLEIVESLLVNGFEPNVQVEDGWGENGSTALIYAAKKGYPDIVKVLLDKRANPDIQDRNGWNALMFAAKNGYLEIVKELLANEVDFTLKCSVDKNAYDLAVQYGHDSVAEEIKKAMDVRLEATKAVGLSLERVFAASAEGKENAAALSEKDQVQVEPPEGSIISFTE